MGHKNRLKGRIPGGILRAKIVGALYCLKEPTASVKQSDSSTAQKVMPPTL